MQRTRPAGIHRDTASRTRDIVDRIGDKWSLAIIHQLGWGAMRFSDLKRSVDGIGQRALTVTLRALERDGLVERTARPEGDDYELTPLGKSLLETVSALMNWTVKHLDDIDRAREHYDTGS